MVATIQLNRPDQLNALDLDSLTLFEQLIQSLANREDIRAVVITGSNDVFCTGTDLDFFRELQAKQDTATYRRYVETVRKLLLLIRRVPQWVIAAVNGLATGGGFQLCLSCDWAIAADHAYFGDVFVRLGVHPDWGGYWFLPQRIGEMKTLELMASEKLISAPEALRMGLINEAVPAPDLPHRIQEVGRRVAEGPPLVLRKMKMGIYERSYSEWERISKLEVESQIHCFNSDDSREGMEAFAKKRKAKFQGR